MALAQETGLVGGRARALRAGRVESLLALSYFALGFNQRGGSLSV